MHEVFIPAGSERRREDPRLITGHASYVDDLRVGSGRPSMLHMVVVRSLYAHAEIEAIHLEDAQALPGVVAVLSGSDLVETMPAMENVPIPRKQNKPLRKPLATQRVRYVGDPVAVIVAENLAVALDAHDLVEIDYVPLPAVVEIDAETGEIHILQYVAVDDGGNVLSHHLADAQIHGGLAQGIGQALYEETLYNQDGQVLSATLMDYTLPNAGQIPVFQTAFVETPSPINPLGAKGVGESGTTGAPPTIVNAVLDALAPLGIRVLDMPLRPEKIWTKIAAAHAGNPPETDSPLPALFRAFKVNQESGTSTFA